MTCSAAAPEARRRENATRCTLTRTMPTCDRSGLTHGLHLWHQALVVLERGDVARLLAVYAERAHRRSPPRRR